MSCCSCGRHRSSDLSTEIRGVSWFMLSVPCAISLMLLS